MFSNLFSLFARYGCSACKEEGKYSVKPLIDTPYVSPEFTNFILYVIEGVIDFLESAVCVFLEGINFFIDFLEPAVCVFLEFSCPLINNFVNHFKGNFFDYAFYCLFHTKIIPYKETYIKC